MGGIEQDTPQPTLTITSTGRPGHILPASKRAISKRRKERREEKEKEKEGN